MPTEAPPEVMHKLTQRGQLRYIVAYCIWQQPDISPFNSKIDNIVLATIVTLHCHNFFHLIQI